MKAMKTMKTRKRTQLVGIVLPAAALVMALCLLTGPAGADSPGATTQLTQLTTDGCCTSPFWSTDSQQVLYIDKPGDTSPVGIYGVDTAQPQQEKLVTSRIALYTEGMSFVIDLQPGSTTLERVSDGERWTVPANSAAVSISPNQARIAWTESTGSRGSSSRTGTTRIWVADLDGSNEQMIATVSGGSISGWISDDVLLVNGRNAPGTLERILYRLPIASGELTELARAENLRGQSLSPDGAWLAYQVTFNVDEGRNGLWLMKTDGSEQFRAPSELFGDYQWRDGHRLVIVPFRPTAVNHELWELDMTTQETRRLNDPQAQPFKINDGDWTVSPDGRKVVFVSASDHNLWLLSLPE